MFDYEDFNQPETIKIDREYYFQLKQEIDFYELTIRFIKEELNSNQSEQQIIKLIRQDIEKLEEQLRQL